MTHQVTTVDIKDQRRESGAPVLKSRQIEELLLVDSNPKSPIVERAELDNNLLCPKVKKPFGPKRDQ